MKKIYAIIVITLTLLIINICLSLYINSDEYYENNYLSQYYKLKNMPTIIPFDFEEPNYEYDYSEEDYFYQNVDVKANLAHILNNNKYNTSYKSLNYCYSLLSEFIYCLSIENDRNYKCQKLFNEKINELEKCELINFNNSINNMKNNIVDFNLPNYDMNTDIEDEFENEKKFNEINDFSLQNENENNKINQIALIDENNKGNIDNSNMDCIEYGLIDEHIICTKYE